jgi:hypothetical protein
VGGATSEDRIPRGGPHHGIGSPGEGHIVGSDPPGGATSGDLL